MKYLQSNSLFFITNFIVVLLSVFLARNAVYVPSDQILLNCGSSSEATDADGRKWLADSASKSTLSSDNSFPATAAFQDPSLPSSTPYMSARIFSSESTYNFAVNKSERHWVRLHFYPSTYNNLAPENSFFSVATADGITLLKNFSAYITATALTQAYIVKEFCILPGSDGHISLIFSPSNNHNASYAFVNGIEIVSMPDIFSAPAVLVGFSDQSVEVGQSALQMMYRVNVGGQYVPASNDSGLSRTWYDDSPYIYGAGFGVTFSASDDLVIKYPAEMLEYIAPVDIYRTARSMGPDPKINVNYNLTWIFQIDANFTYIVRLHFCELQMSKINQRAFDIFINNRTAQAQADVIGWTSEKAVPTYKDYAVYVTDGSGDEQIWVALHPSTAAKPEYYDAILNGLEIFKISDNAGNLAGPNPEPSAMLAKDELARTFESESNTKVHTFRGAAAGGVAAASVAALAMLVVLNQRKKRMYGNDSGGVAGWLPLYGNSHSSGGNSTVSGRSCGSSHMSNLTAMCRHFSFAEIKKATRSFDESLVIGVGGFGKVYKGIVDEGTKVAIKRSNPSSEQGVNEFQTEIEMLSKLRHKHLVSLIGCCEENGEMILVYDYMAHGTLREHLYKCNKPPLSWKQRLEICIGAARGLHYLHTGSRYPIIHRDVKTTNILVDENWVAKVSDFGLSKTGPTMNQSHVSTMVKGSFGYLDPEYFRRQQLTDKSDVYSFGVVLFEVLCARPALNPSLPREQVSLADWALHCQKKGVLADIVDPHLEGKVGPECLKKFADTAEMCLSDHGIDRPSMGNVLWNLEFALQLQESFESGKPIVAEEKPSRPVPTSIIIEEESEDSSDPSTSAVFSQIVHPVGR